MNQNSTMLAIQLDTDVEARLEELASRLGRTKAECVQDAILEHLQDMEDYQLAGEAASNTGPSYTADEAKRELGL